jgi:hypothetical protein
MHGRQFKASVWMSQGSNNHLSSKWINISVWDNLMWKFWKFYASFRSVMEVTEKCLILNSTLVRGSCYCIDMNCIS